MQTADVSFFKLRPVRVMNYLKIFRGIGASTVEYSRGKEELFEGAL